MKSIIGWFNGFSELSKRRDREPVGQTEQSQMWKIVESIRPVRGDADIFFLNKSNLLKITNNIKSEIYQ